MNVRGAMGRNPTNTSGFSSLNPTYTKMAKVLNEWYELQVKHDNLKSKHHPKDKN
ncbi:hypothetical protein MEO93_19920 [Dolichospermum sp. ST_sed3]|nr:hypothetical protein [Dolichospermum sp. ST_sed6]MDD1442589.1 hypothetical protein [Dolichospermum sp. ST_sed3]MDD1454982.1 hypothetical protein [Dolichospermum sp. ST_sed7]MDD1460517.1 hypothetical protein [Dolichospermum sp. ST_sed2]MDD1473459.1 hypothetical protein [Dolichospermum sp. ST_sed4]